MTREEFRRQYDTHRPRLDMELAELKELLEAGIRLIEQQQQERGMPPGIFRIRLKEGRVKECDALYTKIEDDKDLRIDRAFEPGHIRDLLGARLVCHNLSDVRNVVDTLRRGKWGELHHVEPDKGEKNWIEEPQLPSGYRGCHVDVRWQRKGAKAGTFSFAELQVRTLLQDAWATFMHDDVYKQKAKLMLPEELFGQFFDMSNILYALDQMAQRIRKGIEEAKLVSSSKIKAYEAVSQAMFAMLAYAKTQFTIPEYTEVERADKYRILGEDGDYTFEINARCKKNQEFHFPVAGDTPNDRMESLIVQRHDRNGLVRLEGNQYQVVKPSGHPNVVVIKDAKRSTIHHYTVSCRWNGVFSLGREYVWCPWAATYHGAMRKYRLSLGFEAEPRVIPRLYSVGEYSSLDEIISSAERGQGRTGTKVKDGSVTWFEFEVTDPNDDFLCIFAR